MTPKFRKPTAHIIIIIIIIIINDLETAENGRKRTVQFHLLIHPLAVHQDHKTVTNPI
jgi:hypothetical protein